MTTHDSAVVLVSDEARVAFVEPDLDPMPGQGDAGSGDGSLPP